MDVIGVAHYTTGFAVMAAIYAIFSLGLNVHWGYTGLFNIGIAGFFALGAYTSALLSTARPDPLLFEDFKFGGNLPDILGVAKLNLEIWWFLVGLLAAWVVWRVAALAIRFSIWRLRVACLGIATLAIAVAVRLVFFGENLVVNLGGDLWFPVALLAAGAVCGVVALVIGLLTLRLREDYLAIATLGIAEAVRLVFLNEKWLANGSKGLYRVPKVLGDVVSPKNYDYLYLGVVIVVLVLLYVAVERVLRSPWGRVLKAIREDETTAAASGKNVFSFKLQSFMLGAVIMGIGGSLYAHNIRFVNPLSFDPLLATFIIWAMLMVGGSGNNKGAILGAFVVWGIWTGTQFLPGFLSDPNFRFFMIGFLIVAVILLRPGGILGEERRTTRPAPSATEATPPEP